MNRYSKTSAMASLSTLAIQEQAHAKADAPRVISYGSSIHMAHEQAGTAQHNSALDKALRYAGLGTTAISLTPYLMKKAGVGEKEFQFFAANCCPVIQKNGPSWTSTSYGEPTYGIAGAIASGLERIPVVGGELSRGGLANALGAGGLMLLGHYGGHALEGNAPAHSTRHRLGRGFGDAARLLGLVVAVPAVLPAVGHSVAFISSVLGIDQIDYAHRNATGPATQLMGVLGKAPGECKREMKLNDGAYGGIGMLCCAFPAIVTSLLSLITPRQDQGISR